jgi:outer membrane protein W
MNPLPETRERFLKSILAKVPADRVAEIHFFASIKQGGVESGVAVVAAWPESSADPAPQPEVRPVIYTARYRLTLKGPDRGKWETNIVAEADAPLVTVDAVVRGVQRRAGERMASCAATRGRRRRGDAHGNGGGARLCRRVRGRFSRGGSGAARRLNVRRSDLHRVRRVLQPTTVVSSCTPLFTGASMRHSRMLTTVVLGLLASTTRSTRAQAPDSLSLAGKSYFSFSLGLTSRAEASSDATAQRAATRGELGLLAFTHFVSPTVAFQAAAASLGNEAASSIQGQHVNGVASLLVGFSYAPRPLALSRAFRPFASMLVGTYINDIAQNSFTGQTALTQSAFGSRSSAGVNWFFNRHLMANAEVEYHAVNRFAHPELHPQNPNGFTASIGFGVGWGGR